MKIPTKFKLMGLEITVEYDPNLVHNDDYHGAADYRNSKIIIQPDVEGLKRPKQSMESTFCHELVHFILWAMSEEKLRKDERFVDLFSGLLHQVLITMEYESKGG